MDENIEMVFWLLGIAAAGLLATLGALLWRAYANKRENAWEEQREKWRQ